MCKIATRELKRAATAIKSAEKKILRQRNILAKTSS
jgi:hypothetical protein